MEQLFETFQRISDTPRAQMEHYLAQGKQVVGCFPVYTPELIAYAAGMIPIGMWGADMEPLLAKRYLPAFGCPVMQANLELGLRGAYQGLSAVMIPTLCDTFRCITQNWLVGVDTIPMIPVTYPQNRTNAAITFLATEFQGIAKRLEEISGKAITQEALSQAIEVYTQHSQIMLAFAKLANDHLDVVTPTRRHAVMKSAWFMDKAEHTQLVQDLMTQLEALSVYESSAKRVMLTGILAEPIELFRILEDNQLDVVWDDLGQETRQYRTPILDGEEGFHRLAMQWKDMVCSLVYDPEKARIGTILTDVKDSKTQGVIACMMKFCDPEEYDFPLFSAALREIGVPTLYLEIDMHAASMEQARTRIQAFAEML